MEQPRVIATVQTRFENLRSVACLQNGNIWTSGNTNDIKCFDIEGSLIETFKRISGTFPNDIAVDHDGNLLFSSGAAKTVSQVKNGQIEEFIKFHGWKPYNLCVTTTGGLLVTMYSYDETQSKVARYSGSTEKQTIQFDGEGKPLYSGNRTIKYITENINQDVCVADYAAGAVVVVNQAGKLRWRYTGPSTSTNSEHFKPLGIKSDMQGRILVADYYNHCIHILDQNGQFLLQIESLGLKNPFGLCLDAEGVLCVCDRGSGDVKKILYSK